MSGYDLDREAFIGPYRSFHNPAAVERGLCLGSEAYGDNACGAIQSDIELAPGETRSILVLLGVGKADRDGAKIIQEFATPERAQQELVALKRYWHGLLESLRCDTPDDDFDHMVNVWNAYNAMITFTWSRACSLVYTGENRDGLGYRDSVQDAMGVVSLVPAQARERLELMFAGQESTGGARPEIKPWLHKPGHMPPTPADGYRSDDCLWFFNAIPAYLGETGDVDFLQLVLPYSDCGEDTVFAHLRRALEFNLERTGQNGLPCGLQADWNDCLKLGYRGESVFVAFQVRFGLGVYADLAQRLGLADQAAWANQQRESLDSRIQAVCWDGSWFIWAVAEDGTVYGSKNYPEGQVYLNTQVWSVLSGAANPSQAQQALASVHQRLATPYGIMLCDPPFEKTSVNVMRAVLFNPGCKENAGIFCHTQSWAVMAECMMGNGDRAYEYYRAFMPSAYNDRAEIRQIEPFVHCQSTHGSASPKFGVSRLPWLSGTASWSYYAATQWILGIRPEIDGLRIDPCIPRDWQGFTVNRRFRGMNLHIVVRNESGAGFGVKSLALDGQSAPPGILPTASLRDGCHIDVVL
jgi:cellobiose phosphorylase